MTVVRGQHAALSFPDVAKDVPIRRASRPSASPGASGRGGAPGAGAPGASWTALCRPGLRYRPGGQGGAGHPGQRLEVPHRLDLERRSGYGATATPTGWPSRSGPPTERAADRRDPANLPHRRNVAVPISIGAAFALTERMPRWIPGHSGSPSSCWPESRAWSSASGGSSPSGPFWPGTSTHRRQPYARRARAQLLPQPGRPRRGTADRGPRPRPHDRPDHQLHHPDLFLPGSPAAQGRGRGPRHDRLGGGQPDHLAVGPLRHHRGHGAGPRPGSWRDHRRSHDLRFHPRSVAPNIYGPITTIAATS